MELGATVCTPTSPRCTECPVATDCEGRRLGIAATLPNKPAPRAPVDVRAMAVLARMGEHVLAHRIEAGAVNSGQVELPGGGMLETVDSEAELQDLVAHRFGAALRVGRKVAELKHAITHHRIRLAVHEAQALDPGRLVALRTDDPQVPWTTASRKAFRAAGLPTA
jgi:A/G-specific adenine glycosylase